MNYSDKIFMVTGGAGFVGSHIVDQLVERNSKKIIIIDDFSRGSLKNLEWASKNGDLEIINDSILNYNLLCDKMIGVDTVFHQAAIRITQCAEDPKLAHEVMSSGTFNVAKAAVDSKVRKIIAASSASIYGQADIFPTSEIHPPYNNDTIYGATKVYLEGIMKSFKAMYDLDYVALRYFNIYGTRMDTYGKYTEVIIRWLNCVKEHKSPIIFGDGNTSMDLINVRDIAHSNILAMESNITDDVFNIGSQTETSLKELLETILQVNKSSLKPIFKDERSVNAVSRRFADISRASSCLNFSPQISLNEGILELSDWYFNL